MASIIDHLKHITNRLVFRCLSPQGKIRLAYRRKVKRIIRNNPRSSINTNDKTYQKEILNFWSGINISTDWHYLYSSVNGQKDPKYVPEDLFYHTIEPKLNRYEFSSSYSDKNAYHMIFPDIRQPVTVIKNINGYYYNVNNEMIDQVQVQTILSKLSGEYFIKPSLESGGGKNVQKIQISYGQIFQNERPVSLAELESVFRKDFLIQEKLEQSIFLSQFHPDSLNTIRLTTLRNENNHILLSAVVRFGQGGKALDNQRSGGVSCGISDDGILNRFAVDMNGNVFFEHPSSRVKFEGLNIPNFEYTKAFVKNLHTKLAYFKMVSWDIALDPDNKPVLIEINLKGQGINLHQYNNGPIFGDLTNSIIKSIL